MQSLQTAPGSRICLFLPAFYRWQSRKCSGEALQRQEYISNYTAEWMVQSGVWAGSEICAVKIEPLAEKFAENFSHRDFMGAILNLGIDRSTIGDICVEGKCAYVFCTSAMSVFLQETLEQVRHTKVRCVPVEKLEALPEKKLSYREEHVASLRCDGIVSAVWRLSRSQGQTLFSQKKVFVNGRLTENGSQMLKDGDTVSVRGFGKFIFRGEKNTTKKGRLVIGADLFV